MFAYLFVCMYLRWENTGIDVCTKDKSVILTVCNRRGTSDVLKKNTAFKKRSLQVKGRIINPAAWWVHGLSFHKMDW